MSYDSGSQPLNCTTLVLYYVLCTAVMYMLSLSCIIHVQCSVPVQLSTPLFKMLMLSEIKMGGQQQTLPLQLIYLKHSAEHNSHLLNYAIWNEKEWTGTEH